MKIDLCKLLRVKEGEEFKIEGYNLEYRYKVYNNRIQYFDEVLEQWNYSSLSVNALVTSEIIKLPMRDYKSMWSEMNSIVKSYSKVGKRNKNAIEHGKLSKHMMHLIRLYLMCLDILEHEEIITYREKDLGLLMDIRNGKYLDSNNQPTNDFFEMVDDFENKLEYAKQNTSLPDKPNYKSINEFVMSVNERIVKGEI